MVSARFLLIVTVLGTALAVPPLQLKEIRSHSFLREESKLAARKFNVQQEQGYLLPTSVVPTKYVVKLRPILYQDDAATGDALYTAPGYVAIQGVAKNATSEIVLHRHPTLNITAVQVTGPNNEVIEVTGTSYDESMHFYTIKLGKQLVVDQTYEIASNFIAPVSTNRNAGLYLGLYNNTNNEEKRMATTQFESAGARAAFPCFDEPSLKAKFSISLARPKSKTQFQTLSNTIITNSTDHADLPNWVWDNYQETVTMSTYLLAFVVAEDYDFREAAAGTFNKPVRVYGPKYLLDRNGGEFSATASAVILTHLQDKYKYPYEMPKMDSIAIPRNYFGGGAMENWGLNTYRDERLLYYPGESGESQRQAIYSILAHELGHQWFGDLVTCGWWTNIWLNEGFATYVSFYGVQNASNNEFDYVREMLWDTVQYALNYDVGIDGSVINDAHLPDEIENVFGSLTYHKGGSLARMMEALLGEQAFTEALAEYLRMNAYTAVLQDQLFEVLTKYALRDGRIPNTTTIKSIMDTWTLQPGYPLVRVNSVGSSFVYISQEKFMTQPKAGSPPSSSNDLTLWEIPIAIATPSGPEFSKYEPKLWLNHYTLSASHRHSVSDWLIVNPEGKGFYRVLYDEKLLQNIKTVLESDFGKIGSLSRSQLLDDYFNMAKHRYVNIRDALDLTTFLHDEDDHVVWYTIFTDLTKARTMFSNEDLSNFRTYWLSKIEPVLDRLMWDQAADDKGTRVLFRAKLLDWACTLGSSQCMTQARIFLDAWKNDASAVPALDIQPVYYCAMVAEGGEEAYDLIVERISSGGLSEFQKTRLLTALTCSKDGAVLPNLLDRVLEKDSDYGAAATTILQGVAGNSAGRTLAFNFIREQFDQLKNAYGDASLVTSTASTLGQYFTKQSEHDDLEAFITAKDAELSEGEKRSLRSVLTAIKANMEWIDEFYNDMNSWFEENKP